MKLITICVLTAHVAVRIHCCLYCCNCVTNVRNTFTGKYEQKNLNCVYQGIPSGDDTNYEIAAENIMRVYIYCRQAWPPARYKKI